MKRGMWAGAVIVLLLAGGGAWLALGSRDGPLPPPDGPWPTSATVQVDMCTKDAVHPKCDGRPLATMADARAVLAELLAFHGISQARITEGVGGVGKGAYVKATLADRDGFPALKASIERLPGVGVAMGRPTPLWTGKADLEISLCPEKPAVGSGPCVGRGPATEDEKDTIYRRLHELPEVAAVYFADRAFVAREAARNVRVGMSGGWEQVASNPPEEFHIKLADGGEPAAEKVRKLTEGLPGVLMTF